MIPKLKDILKDIQKGKKKKKKMFSNFHQQFWIPTREASQFCIL